MHLNIFGYKRGGSHIYGKSALDLPKSTTSLKKVSPWDLHKPNAVVTRSYIFDLTSNADERANPVVPFYKGSDFIDEKSPATEVPLTSLTCAFTLDPEVFTNTCGLCWHIQYNQLNFRWRARFVEQKLLDNLDRDKSAHSSYPCTFALIRGQKTPPQIVKMGNFLTEMQGHLNSVMAPWGSWESAQRSHS